MFNKILLWSRLVLDFCLLEVFESVSILVLVIGLFLFSISSWFSLEKWYLSKNLSISSRLSHFIGVWLLVKVAQLYPILGDSVDCNLPGSSVHGIFQAGVLEWLAVLSPRDLPNPGIEPHSLALHILYSLSYQGSPRILEWVAYPFSSAYCWPRNWTWVDSQVDSLPAELPGKPPIVAHTLTILCMSMVSVVASFFLPTFFFLIILILGCCVFIDAMHTCFLQLWWAGTSLHYGHCSGFSLCSACSVA